MHVKKDDLVVIIAGDDADPKRARKVLRVVTKTNKVVVEGVNRVYKHVRARADRRNPQGGRLSKEMPVDASNVALIDPQSNRPTRVGTRYLADGTKELYAKRSGARIRTLAKPNPKYAQKG